MAKRKIDNPYKDRICNHAQIGGIETSILDNGPGKGVRIAWINTGTGLRYKVVIDRAMDIADAFYNEHSLAWLGQPGITAPRPDANAGLEWLYTFGAGLMTTCGLTHTGGPESDENETRGLHGRISNIPATIESIIQPDPAAGKMDMSITGVIRQTRLYGEDLELRRTISSRIGEATIKIHDTVTNRGPNPCPHMMLYHCNFGYPLVDKGADIIWEGTCESFGRDGDEVIFNEKHNCRKCQGSLEAHRAGESCAVIDVTADGKGYCNVGVYNSRLKLALMMKYKKKQLPALTNWQHWGYGDYVNALEPGTNPPIGQNKAKETKKLIILKPGQSKSYDLQIDILTDLP